MIRITVELVPFGVEEQARTLCTAKIANDGTGSKTRGNYRYRFEQVGRNAAWRKGRVTGFRRKREHVWRLVLKCLIDACKE